MTTGAPTGLGRADARRLLAEAQAVVEALEQLPDRASDERAREWAHVQARAARDIWDGLMQVVAAGEARRFGGLIKAVVSTFVPLQDAPEELTGAAEQVIALDNVLAADYRATWEPLIGPDGTVPPQVLAELGPALVSLAPEFGAPSR